MTRRKSIYRPVFYIFFTIFTVANYCAMWIFTAFLLDNVIIVQVDFSLVSYSIFSLIAYCSFGWISLDFLLYAFKQSFPQIPTMEWITCYKSLQKYMLTKDPNFGIFSDTSGRITKTYQIEWPRVYSIFDNDDLPDI